MELNLEGLGENFTRLYVEDDEHGQEFIAFAPKKGTSDVLKVVASGKKKAITEIMTYRKIRSIACDYVPPTVKKLPFFAPYAYSMSDVGPLVEHISFDGEDWEIEELMVLLMHATNMADLLTSKGFSMKRRAVLSVRGKGPHAHPLLLQFDGITHHNPEPGVQLRHGLKQAMLLFNNLGSLMDDRTWDLLDYEDHPIVEGMSLAYRILQRGLGRSLYSSMRDRAIQLQKGIIQQVDRHSVSAQKRAYVAVLESAARL